MKISSIRVTQPLGEFYISKIKAKDLLRISTSSVLRYEKDGSLRGNQRPLKPDRLKLIANYIKSEEMCFPTSIIVAANVNDKGLIEEENKRWRIEHVENDVYNLIIPDGNDISSLIIDGQHRLNAFSLTSDSYNEIELVCSVFFDLPAPYQAYLFATINGNQKRVDKSLALELFGYSVDNEPQNTWSPEKLAVYLTRKFNFTKDSPLYQRIKLAPLYSQLEDVVDKSKWMLSTAAMVDGILKLISSNPQKDRDFLAIKKEEFWSDKTRKSLVKLGDKSVLRDLYINCDDDRIYEILNSFFQSVKSILWDNASPNSVITKTIGISVLFDILNEILRKDVNIVQFDEYISLIKHINYSNNYFQLSGLGKTRLRRIMRCMLGFIKESDLEKEEYDIVKEQKSIIADEYNKQALSCVDNGDFDKAIENFNKAIACYPKHAKAYYGRGNAYLQQKNYPESIKDLQTTINLCPDIIKAYYVLGLVYYTIGEYSNALDVLNDGYKKARIQGDLVMRNQIEKEINREQKMEKNTKNDRIKEKFGETEGEMFLSYVLNQLNGKSQDSDL